MLASNSASNFLPTVLKRFDGCLVFHFTNAQQMQKSRKTNCQKNCVTFRFFNTSMQLRNHYDTLGIGPEASQDEIREAYIKMSKKHHPDVAKSEDSKEVRHDRITALNEAYSVLCKPNLRHNYDMTLPWVKYDRKPGDNVFERDGHVFHRRAHQAYQEGRPMTQDEMRQAFGYPEPMDLRQFKEKTRRNNILIVAGCFVFAAVGFVVHFAIAKLTFSQHEKALVKMTREGKAALKADAEYRKQFASHEEYMAELYRANESQLPVLERKFKQNIDRAEYEGVKSEWQRRAEAKIKERAERLNQQNEEKKLVIDLSKEASS